MTVVWFRMYFFSLLKHFYQKVKARSTVPKYYFLTFESLAECLRDAAVQMCLGNGFILPFQTATLNHLDY